MKATIPPKTDRIVTITMTATEARDLCERFGRYLDTPFATAYYPGERAMHKLMVTLENLKRAGELG
jgi:hypothetical protein